MPEKIPTLQKDTGNKTDTSEKQINNKNDAANK